MLVTRGSKRVKKREMWHLEAFAMLGELAWQATTLIKMIVVSRGEIARGLFYFSPGFSPLCPGVPCCVAVTTDPSSSWHNVLPSRIDHGATHRTSKVQPLIYSWNLRKACRQSNYLSSYAQHVLGSFTLLDVMLTNYRTKPVHLYLHKDHT